MAKKASKPVATNPVKKSIKPIPFFITGLLFIALSVIISFSPDISRGWGLNYIRFFAPTVVVVYYTLLFCFWFPPVNQLIVRLAVHASKADVPAFLARYKYVWFVLVSIAFGYAFHLLTIKYIFLGDLDIRPKQIEQGVLMPDEYLTMLFHKHVYALLHSKFGTSGLQTVRLFDYVCGSFFIFISLCTSDLLGNTFLKKLSVFLISTLSCAILLQFCGYTDVYALPVLFLSLYLFTCILHLKGKIGIYLPFIILLTGIGFHLLLVCLFPSFIFLFYRSVLWKYPLFRKKNTIITLLVLASPFLYVAFHKFALPKMIPISSDDDSLMTMFSASHWKEFVNAQLLASGIGFLLWIVTLLHSLLNRIKYDAMQWFLFIASLSILGLVFVFNALRGSGDWDIMSFAAIVYNLSNACYLLSMHNAKWCHNIKYGVVMMAGFSVLHTSFWIATNKTDASIEWVEQAFMDDPAGYYKMSFNNEAMLASMFHANKLYDKSLKWHQKAYRKYVYDPRIGFNYAVLLLSLDRKDEAIAILENSVNRFPDYSPPYPQLARIYSDSNNPESLYVLLTKMEAAYKNNQSQFELRLPKENIDALLGLLNEMRKN